jgi:hypothetical protein
MSRSSPEHISLGPTKPLPRPIWRQSAKRLNALESALKKVRPRRCVLPNRSLGPVDHFLSVIL